MTEREIFLQILRREKPERFPKIGTIQLDFVPGEHSFEPQGGLDWFGVFWHREPDGTQCVPPGQVRIPSMADWKEAMGYIHEDEMKYWGEKTQQGYDRENSIQIVGIQSGPFERMQSLVGFENALTAFYEYPDELHEYMDAMTEYKCEQIRQIKKYYNPDIVSPHDDWGSNMNMFFSRDLWCEYIKPGLKRMVDTCHEEGMLFEQHTCGYITQVFGDMVECGVDMAEIQSVNDLAYIKEHFGNQIILRGCMNGQKLGSPSMTPEEAYKEVRCTLDIIAKDGCYIPGRVWGSRQEVQDAIFKAFDVFAAENF